jgi:hypothetical protein
MTGSRSGGRSGGSSGRQCGLLVGRPRRSYRHPIPQNSLVFSGKRRPALDLIQSFTGVTSLKIRANKELEISPFRLVRRIYMVVGIAQHIRFTIDGSSFKSPRSSIEKIHAEHSLVPAAAMISSLSARESRPSRGQLGLPFAINS